MEVEEARARSAELQELPRCRGPALTVQSTCRSMMPFVDVEFGKVPVSSGCLFWGWTSIPGRGEGGGGGAVYLAARKQRAKPLGES